MRLHKPVAHHEQPHLNSGIPLPSYAGGGAVSGGGTITMPNGSVMNQGNLSFQINPNAPFANNTLTAGPAGAPAGGGGGGGGGVAGGQLSQADLDSIMNGGTAISNQHAPVQSSPAAAPAAAAPSAMQSGIAKNMAALRAYFGQQAQQNGWNHGVSQQAQTTAFNNRIAAIRQQMGIPQGGTPGNTANTPAPSNVANNQTSTAPAPATPSPATSGFHSSADQPTMASGGRTQAGFSDTSGAGSASPASSPSSGGSGSMESMAGTGASSSKQPPSIGSYDEGGVVGSNGSPLAGIPSDKNSPFSDSMLPPEKTPQRPPANKASATTRIYRPAEGKPKLMSEEENDEGQKVNKIPLENYAEGGEVEEQATGEVDPSTLLGGGGPQQQQQKSAEAAIPDSGNTLGGPAPSAGEQTVAGLVSGAKKSYQTIQQALQKSWAASKGTGQASTTTAAAPSMGGQAAPAGGGGGFAGNTVASAIPLPSNVPAQAPSGQAQGAKAAPPAPTRGNPIQQGAYPVNTTNVSGTPGQGQPSAASAAAPQGPLAPRWPTPPPQQG